MNTIIEEIEQQLLEELKRNNELMEQLWRSNNRVADLKRDLLATLLTQTIHEKTS